MKHTQEYQGTKIQPAFNQPRATLQKTARVVKNRQEKSHVGEKCCVGKMWMEYFAMVVARG